MEKIADFLKIHKDILEKEMNEFLITAFEQELFEIVQHIPILFNSVFQELGNKLSSRLWRSSKAVSIIISMFDPEYLLRYKEENNGLNMLALLLKNGLPKTCWEYLTKVLPKELEDSHLEKRLEILLEKGVQGMSLIDYSFVKRKHSIGEYIKSLTLKLEGDLEIVFPKLLKISLIRKQKNENVLKKEAIIFENMKKMSTACSSFKSKKVGKGILPPLSLTHYSEILKNPEIYNSLVNLTQKVRDTYSKKNKVFNLVDINFKSSVIEDEKSLRKIINQLQKQLLISVDVEFTDPKIQIDLPKNRNHIHNIAASIQISTLKQVYFIDSIKLHSVILEILGPIFQNEKILKIFHSCEGDVNVLYQSFGVITMNIFDTCKADRVVKNYKDTRGLSTLVKNEFSFDIDKSFQVATWNVRPLPMPMIDYAVNDAVLLLPLFTTLLQKAQLKNERGTEIKIWGLSNHITKWIKQIKDNVALQID